MPSLATPLPVTPAAPPANPARSAIGEVSGAFAELLGETSAGEAEISPKPGQIEAGRPFGDGEGDAENPGNRLVETGPPTAMDPSLAIPLPAPAPGPQTIKPGQPSTNPDLMAGGADLAGDLTAAAAVSAIDTTPKPAAGAADLAGDLTAAAAVSAIAATPKPAAGELDLAVAVEKPAAETKSQTQAAKPDAEGLREALARMAQPTPVLTRLEARPTDMSGAAEPVNAAAPEADAAAPEIVDTAATQSLARERSETAADILAPLKEARPATERTPGELLRSDIRDARGAATLSDVKPDAKTAMAEAKPAPAPAASQAANPPAPSATPIPTPQATPAFELLLAQMNGAMAADPVLADAPADPALAKSDTAFDPAAVRVEARNEVRTASTLQFAQGPRLTPHSAQTMAAQIAQRFNEGSRIFDIRMDPPELGRVEVRLEVGSDNTVRALLAAERTETLAELQRSARDLERALADAGLELGEDALSFSLTDDGAAADDFGDDGAPDQPVFAGGDAGLEPLSGPLAPLSTYGFLLARAEGLDVSV